MAGMTTLAPFPRDNNPIALLLMLKGKKAVIEPPVGTVFITDENTKLLRDEQGAYLFENKEE